MVHLLQCSSSVLYILLLLVASSMEVAFSDARRLPLRLLPLREDTSGTNKAVAADNKDAAAARSKGETEWRRALIGSRPPRCERVCMSCGHCEAVQVPIVPQEQKARTATATSAAAAVTLTATLFTYRVDGVTNYKPLSWKCRCGGTILDP